ncbi:MAG TPA: hypothetical protein VFX05_04120 [Casimicrobiaceae bacterium]|nr:hypothetical protein [Casimicrobiaceae bacterium]
MRINRWTLATLLALGTAAPLAGAQQCVGFDDTLDDVFCPAVEWLKNRSITTGCVGNSFCPSAPVSRLAMAQFMSRLGKALTPSVLHKEAIVPALAVASTQPGTLLCATGDYAVVGFPRSARFLGTFFGTPDVASGPSWIQGYWKYSIDAGTTWNYVGNWLVDQVVGRDWADVGQVAGATVLAPPMALSPGLTYRFGLFVDGMGAPYSFHALMCQLDVTIHNANPATSPLDD